MEQAPLSLTKKSRALMIVAAVVFACPIGAAGQSTPPSEPPADWGPTAIDYSNVPYPYPVEYLDVSLD